MNNKACDGVINVISLSLFLFHSVLRSLFLSLQTPLTSLFLFSSFFSSLSLTLYSLPLTAHGSRLMVKPLSFFFSFFFLISFSHTLYSLPLMTHDEASLFSRSALGGWDSDRLWVGGLQVGFRLARVAPDRRGWLQTGVGLWVAVGSRGVVGSHGWPWVLLLVGVFGWLEFQRCFNRVFRLLEFQRCFNGVSRWME